MVAQIQTRIQELTAQTQALAQGLNRTNIAFESQQERLGQNETELAARKSKPEEKTKVLEEKAAGSRENQLVLPSSVPKPLRHNGKNEKGKRSKFKHIFLAWSSMIHGCYPRTSLDNIAARWPARC